MAIVTTYVCDVSGKTGIERSDFIDVELKAFQWGAYKRQCGSITKLIHKDIALKLNLIEPTKDEERQPEISFEGKLKLLLEDLVQGIVEENMANQ